jgi:hypothetical protein
MRDLCKDYDKGPTFVGGISTFCDLWNKGLTNEFLSFLKDRERKILYEERKSEVSIFRVIYVAF